MATRAHRSGTWFPLAVLLAAAGVLVVVHAAAGDALRSVAGLSDGLLVASCALSALAIFSTQRRETAWRSAPYLGLGILSLGVVSGLFVYQDITGALELRPSVFDAFFVIVAALFVAPIRLEYASHFAKEDRSEITADVALLCAALGAVLFLWIRPGDATSVVSLSAAVFALIAAAAFSAYGALALWAPSPAHVGQFLVMGGFAFATATFGQQWVRGEYEAGRSAVDLPFGLGVLLLAILALAVPRREAASSPTGPTRYGRPLLTTVSVATASAALGLIAFTDTERLVGAAQATGLVLMLAGAVAVRILVNQVRGTHAGRAAREALAQKEIALRETDKALARLQRANETLRESEERLRLVFEAAVDGIVELDHKDLIVRTNEAFCRMLELPHSMVEGQPWTALATAIGADESFAALPHTGQGILLREGHSIYLEARTSEIPGDPPRRLLLVRDVTAQRVADQTIRSLFKFLQDRDEDRTRIMRRTNAAIESERNRIARDLHDGPVQGVSAASLSLEAALLMLKGGDVDEGFEVLTKVRKELTEEADNLRRLMAGLRPPLLEERGLVPALRETLEKFGQENGLETEFVGQAVPNLEIPQDLETLAYRVVQEALSNTGKHAKASRVAVAVDVAGGQIRIEVTDDGVGFDSAQAREFLRMGRVGLASMRERVELANGTLGVHSNPGRGTRVLATLPLASVPAPRELTVSEVS